MSAFTCPRCLKKVDTIHTCTPTDLVRKLEQEIERLRHDIERHIAIASEHATECERLRAELEKCNKTRRNDIDLSIAHLAQIYGLLEEGKVDEASDYCRGAAEGWTQDLVELDAALAAKGGAR